MQIGNKKVIYKVFEYFQYKIEQVLFIKLFLFWQSTIPPKQWTQRRDGANIGTVSGTEVSNGRREAETQF